VYAVNGTCSDENSFTVTITTSNYGTTFISACDTYTWPFNGQTYTTGGTYIEVTACNTQVLELTIITSTFNSTSVVACGSYTWSENGQTYTASGTFTVVTDCHTEELTLTINSLPINTITQSGNTLTADESTAGTTYQWLDCDNGNNPISGATNQTFTATANGQYAVEVTQNNCSDTSACVTISSVGLDEFYDEIKLVVYPNPSGGEYIITTKEGNSSYTITDITGKIVKQGVLSTINTQVDISQEAAGIYFLKVNERTVKLVKK
jgi:hypothetical protein